MPAAFDEATNRTQPAASAVDMPQTAAVSFLHPVGCNRKEKEENGSYDNVPRDGESFVSADSEWSRV